VLQPKSITYRVKKGDTLIQIATAQYGDASVWPQIAIANKIWKPRVLLAGMRLQLPPLTLSPTDHHRRIAGTFSASQHAPGTKSLSSSRTTSAVPSWAGDERAQIAYFQGIEYVFEEDVTKNPPIPLPTPGVEATLQFIGEVALGTSDSVRQLEIKNGKELTIKLDKYGDTLDISHEGEVSGELKSKFDSKLATLEGGVTWKRSGKQAELSCGFTHSTKNRAGKALASQEVGIEQPGDWVKYRCAPEPVKGEIGDLEYEGRIGYVLRLRGRNGIPDPYSWGPAVVPTVELGDAVALFSVMLQMLVEAAEIVGPDVPLLAL
jgi:hypothetical protein